MMAKARAQAKERRIIRTRKSYWKNSGMEMDLTLFLMVIMKYTDQNT